MGVFNTIVDRGVIKVFGGGPLAYVATYGLRWLRESWDNDRSVQFVTSDEIRPGEQYSVIARPAPSRKERALLREKEKRAQVLVRLQRPTRKQRKLAQGIAALQSKQAKLNKKVQPEATGRRDRKPADQRVVGQTRQGRSPGRQTRDAREHDRGARGRHRRRAGAGHGRGDEKASGRTFRGIPYRRPQVAGLQRGLGRSNGEVL